MEAEAEAAEGGMEEISGRIGSYPRDLLRHLSGISCSDGSLERTTEDLGEIDINLGLSLGGCFGVEPSKEKRLLRSSSVAVPPVEYDFSVVDLLTRTSSLPAAAADDEQRKRKELQSLKRLETKRKRLEKRNSRVVVGERDRKEEQMDEEMGDATHWSIGSQGSGFSSASGLQLQQMQEIKKPSLVERDEHKAETSPAAGPPRRLRSYATNMNGATGTSDRRAKGVAGEAKKDIMEEMPCVSTTGVGPNGRRIEGFLYKYGKGEEVRIVCVCHGSFLTPAEFVKHAGGGDVAHPLRHIVVNPSPSTLL